MNDKLNQAVSVLQNYCGDRKCVDCDFYDLTVSHNCRLMTGMPCNWSMPEKSKQ